jgi:excisionase family DNA binding protein
METEEENRLSTAAVIRKTNIPDPDDASLLTPEDVARKFQVPVTWVYACVRGRTKNVMPHVKIGRYLRFEEDAVRHYMEANRRGYRRMKLPDMN